MTKQEFVEKQLAWKHISARTSAIWIISWFSIMGGLIWLKNYVEAHVHADWVNPTFSICFLVVVVGITPFLICFTKRQQKRLGVICSSCGKPLVGRKSKEVIVTGNCSYCGKKIFSEA
jgi:hypothetical protein